MNKFILNVLFIVGVIEIIYGSDLIRNPWTRIELEDSSFEDIANLLHHKDYVIDTHQFEIGQKLSIYANRDALTKLQQERMIFRVQERDTSNYPTDGYMTYAEMVQYLQSNLANTNNMLSKMVSIGKTVESRDIWMFQFNYANVDPKLNHPTVLLVGNIHGNEVVGREMLLLLIEYLANQTREGLNSYVCQMLQKVNVWIIPSLNPDGFEKRMRWNANYYDLNRGFPDQYEGIPHHIQPEVQAMMNLVGNVSFILSASMHGGAQVASYPFDGNADHINQQYSATPEDELIRWIATQYAQNNPLISNSTFFPGGITNGAAWYVLYGGMQDYNYLHGTPEITIELSNNKWPAFEDIELHWYMNREALIQYINISVSNRISGRIIDCEGRPLNSRIKINQEPTKYIPHNKMFSKIVLLNSNITIIVNVSTQQYPSYFDSLDFVYMNNVFEFTVDELPMELIQLDMCKTRSRLERNTKRKPSLVNKGMGERSLSERLEDDTEYQYHVMRAKQLNENLEDYLIKYKREQLLIHKREKQRQFLEQ